MWHTPVLHAPGTTSPLSSSEHGFIQAIQGLLWPKVLGAQGLRALAWVFELTRALCSTAGCRKATQLHACHL